MIFEFETAKAHVINVEDQILQVVDRYHIRRVQDLPPREALSPGTGSELPYRIRIPLLSPITQDQLGLIAAGIPHGVRVRLEGP